jgi:hypothetical protein
VAKLIKDTVRYLFPRQKKKAPLLPLQYSSNRGDSPKTEHARYVARMLKGYGIARTDQDAMRLMRQKGDNLSELIKLKREHRHYGIWATLKRRFSNRW